MAVDENSVVRAHHLRAYDKRYGQMAKKLGAEIESSKSQTESARHAAESATTAAARADGVADDVQAKLDRGDFVGATGATGPKGDTGPQGPKGDKGEPGQDADIAGAEQAIKAAQSAAKDATDAAARADDAASLLTANVLKGNVKDTFIHVDDAWPSSLLSIEIEGACKQDGTPSPEAPVPIVVIENPVLWVTGRNLLDVHEGMPESDCNKEFDNVTKRIIKPGTYAVGLAANNYYLSNTVKNAQIGNGAVSFTQTADGYGVGFGVSLVPGVTYKFSAKGTAEFRFAFYSADGTWLSQLSTTTPTVPTDAVYSVLVLTAKGGQKEVALRDMYGAATQITYAPYVGASLPITLPAEHPYLAALPDGTHDEIVIDKDGNASLVAIVGKTETAATDGVNATVGTDALSSTGAIADGATVYYKLAKPGTYQLGKLDIPSLPETISNVWTDAEVTPRTGIEYVRDVNIAFANIEDAIASITQG